MRLLGANLVAAAVAVVLFGFSVWGTNIRRRRMRGNDAYYKEYDDYDDEDESHFPESEFDGGGGVSGGGDGGGGGGGQGGGGREDFDLEGGPPLITYLAPVPPVGARYVDHHPSDNEDEDEDNSGSDQVHVWFAPVK